MYDTCTTKRYEMDLYGWLLTGNFVKRCVARENKYYTQTITWKPRQNHAFPLCTICTPVHLLRFRRRLIQVKRSISTHSTDVGYVGLTPMALFEPRLSHVHRWRLRRKAKKQVQYTATTDLLSGACTVQEATANDYSWSSTPEP